MARISSGKEQEVMPWCHRLSGGSEVRRMKRKHWYLGMTGGGSKSMPCKRSCFKPPVIGGNELYREFYIFVPNNRVAGNLSFLWKLVFERNIDESLKTSL